MDDAQDLIDRICTVAGMILEDVHEMAVTTQSTASATPTINAIHDAASDVVILARAAAIIAARYGSLVSDVDRG